jgi:hypothetical protein
LTGFTQHERKKKKFSLSSFLSLSPPSKLAYASTRPLTGPPKKKVDWSTFSLDVPPPKKKVDWSNILERDKKEVDWSIIFSKKKNHFNEFIPRKTMLQA